MDSVRGEVVDFPSLEQYRTVGEALTACEAANPRVGIPFLFPTRRVLEAAAKIDTNFDDFVRTSLVGVNTRVLEAYCDELEDITHEAKSGEELFIREPTLVERWGVGALTTAVLTGLAFGTALQSGAEFTAAIRYGLFVLSALTFAFIFVTSETYRRTTLAWVIVEEILRRRGQGTANADPIAIDLSRTSFSGDING